MQAGLRGVRGWDCRPPSGPQAPAVSDGRQAGRQADLLSLEGCVGGACCSRRWLPGPRAHSRCGVRSGGLAYPAPRIQAEGSRPPSAVSVPASCAWVDPATTINSWRGASYRVGAEPRPIRPAESPGLGSGVRSEAPGTALFLGISMTAARWAQKALLLPRGLDVRRRETLRPVGAGRWSLRAVALGSRNPVHLPLGRRGGPALGSDAWGPQPAKVRTE